MITLLWFVTGFIGTLFLDIVDFMDGAYDHRGICPSIQNIFIHCVFALLGPLMFLIGFIYLLFHVIFSTEWASVPIYELFRRKK